MTEPVPLRRRTFLSTGLGLGVGGALAALPALARAALVPTPRQTEGPFYPRQKPAEADSDLARLTGRGADAAGAILHVTGRVLAPDGKPVAGARIEIWQADANGRYLHPLDWSVFKNRDGNFQGFGAAVTDPKGGYAFRTIRPAAYGSRTPHIHFKVRGRDLRTLTTQMYFAGEPLNARDGILNGVRDPARRARLIVPFAPADDLEAGASRGHFEIVLARGSSAA